MYIGIQLEELRCTTTYIHERIIHYVNSVRKHLILFNNNVSKAVGEYVNIQEQKWLSALKSGPPTSARPSSVSLTKASVCKTTNIFLEATVIDVTFR